MTRRRRGRPPKTEHDAFGDLLWLEQILGEEIAALQDQGHKGHKPTKALVRAASRLGISERAAWLRMAEMKRQDEKLKRTIASLAPLLRQLRDSPAFKKDDGTDLFAVNSCSAD